MKATLGALVLASLQALGASAPPPPQVGADVLTLERALQIALDDSHRLRIADAEVQGARAATEEARAALRPEVTVAETFQGSTNPVMVFGNLLLQAAFGPDNFAIPSLNEPDPLTNFNTRLSIAQPLWTGGRLSRRIEAASFEREATSADRARTRQEVVYEVTGAWTAAIVAEAELRVAERARATAASHVALVERLRGAGLVVQSDLLQVRLRESERAELLARARSGVVITRAALNLAMGTDLDAAFLLPADIEIEAPDTDELADLLAEALATRPDLRATELRVSAAQRQVDAARAESWPTVGLSASWEANAEDFIGADGTNWSLGLAARFTVYDGGARGSRVAGAEARRLRMARGRDLLADRIGLEVRRSWHEHVAARERLEQAEAAVELASESLRLVENRYRQGLALLVELLDAETALTGARSRRVAAARDVLLGRAAIDLAVGRR